MGIKVESIENGEKRRVTEDYTYPDGVTINKGFEFDGASSPRPLWFIVAPFKHPTCSGRHDWDCAYARDTMDKAKKFAAEGNMPEYMRFKKLAKDIRSRADKRYWDCKSQRDNKVAGFLAWSGVRIGSFFGSGW